MWLSWQEACKGWDLPAYLERKFGLVGPGLYEDECVVESPFEGGVFVRDVADYVRKRLLVPATARQAWQYVKENPRAQFDHPLVVVGEGAQAEDQHGHPQVLCFSCTSGKPSVQILRQGEKLGSNARLLTVQLDLPPF